MILFYYNKNKKVESQGAKCHARTMMYSEAGEAYQTHVMWSLLLLIIIDKAEAK